MRLEGLHCSFQCPVDGQQVDACVCGPPSELCKQGGQLMRIIVRYVLAGEVQQG